MNPKLGGCLLLIALIAVVFVLLMLAQQGVNCNPSCGR